MQGETGRGGHLRRQLVEGGDALLVATPGDVRDQEEPLTPVVEHDRSIDEQQTDRRTGRLVGMRGRVPVEQGGGLVGGVAEQTARDRGQAVDPGRAEPVHGRPEGLAGTQPSRRLARRQVADDVAQVQAPVVDDHDRGGIAGDERVPAPPFGAFDGFQQDARPLARDGRERATGVATSASSSVQTGTSGHSAAKPSNVSRSGRTRCCRSIDLLLRSERGKPRTSGPGLVGAAGGVRALSARRHRAPRARPPPPGSAAPRHGSAMLARCGRCVNGRSDTVGLYSAEKGSVHEPEVGTRPPFVSKGMVERGRGVARAPGGRGRRTGAGGGCVRSRTRPDRPPRRRRRPAATRPGHDRGRLREAVAPARPRGFRPGSYELEVSSPGIERPLKTPAQFARAVGERLKVRTAAAPDGAATHAGRLLRADEDGIVLEVDGAERSIALRRRSPRRGRSSTGPRS